MFRSNFAELRLTKTRPGQVSELSILISLIFSSCNIPHCIKQAGQSLERLVLSYFFGKMRKLLIKKRIVPWPVQGSEGFLYGKKKFSCLH